MSTDRGYPATCFHVRLRQARKEKRLNQAELAQLAGCSLSTLQRVEWGAQEPSWPLAVHLAWALGLNLLTFHPESIHESVPEVYVPPHILEDREESLQEELTRLVGEQARLTAQMEALAAELAEDDVEEPGFERDAATAEPGETIQTGRGGAASAKARECADWLEDFLGDCAWPDSEVAQAARLAGFTDYCYRVAKGLLRNGPKGKKLHARPRGKGGAWWIALAHPDQWVYRSDPGAKEQQPAGDEVEENARREEVAAPFEPVATGCPHPDG